VVDMAYASRSGAHKLSSCAIAGFSVLNTPLMQPVVPASLVGSAPAPLVGSAPASLGGSAPALLGVPAPASLGVPAPASLGVPAPAPDAAPGSAAAAEQVSVIESPTGL